MHPVHPALLILFRTSQLLKKTYINIKISMFIYLDRYFHIDTSIYVDISIYLYGERDRQRERE